MTIFRFILFFILFFVIARAVRFLINAFAGKDKEERKPKVNKTPDKKFDINRDDIIEAEFEEIKESQEDKS